MRLSQPASILALAVASATVAAHAQADTQTVTAISEWNYDAVYRDGGMTAEKLMDAAVYGADRGEIGSIENILLVAV